MKLFKKMAGMCMFLALGLASCSDDETVEVKNSLSVSPDAAIEFNATGNKSVTLTVKTDADKWAYQAPEWITAEQSGETLVVNAKDNTGTEARNGSIVFSAGTAEQVKINVLQHEPDTDNGGDGDVDEDKIEGSITDEGGLNEVKITFTKDMTNTTAKVKIALAEAPKADVNVNVIMDKEYLTEYNVANGTSYELFPDEALTATEWPVTIAAGSKDAEVSIAIDGTNLAPVGKFLLPLKAEVTADSEVQFKKAESRVNYILNKVNPKEIKQMCIMEFNDANPLSVLEYKLADGSYFFDALVLFSGNMGWDAGTQSVRFNARTGESVINSNTDALVREWQTYLKPIHDAGIKVYMGIMPHHTRAGITTLSYDGCKWFAEEMAQIIRDCQMDGVFLDEEYVGTDGGVMSTEWSTPLANAYGNGAYFAYQMKKQMKLACDWPTEVAVYTYSLGYNWKTVTDHDDQSTHTVAEYADIMVADYGGTASPVGNQTLKNCTGASIQLNYGNSLSESRAKEIKENGYGWIMYFAFNPDPTHHLYTEQATEVFQNVARGCYDQEMPAPTHYYKKIGQGVYDSTRYEY